MMQFQVNIESKDGNTKIGVFQLAREDANKEERELTAALEEFVLAVTEQLKKKGVKVTKRLAVSVIVASESHCWQIQAN